MSADKGCTNILYSWKFFFCKLRKTTFVIVLTRMFNSGNSYYPLTLLVGMQTSTAAMENSVEIS